MALPRAWCGVPRRQVALDLARGEVVTVAQVSASISWQDGGPLSQSNPPPGGSLGASGCSPHGVQLA